MSSARKIAEALGGSSGPDANGNYLCRCPAHLDETPSLSLRDYNGALLAHCFAGCAGSSVFAALFRRGLYVPPDEATGPEADKGAQAKTEPAEPEAEPAADPAEAATRAAAEAAAKKLAEAMARVRGEYASLGSAINDRVDAYLSWRGLKPFETDPEWMRFNPMGKYVEKRGSLPEYFPTLAIAATDPKTHELHSVQYQFLSYPSSGPGFAPVKARRKAAYGCPIHGNVGRMGEPIDGKPLLIGEGWETTKTATDASGLPGWCVFGVPGFKRFDPPDDVHWVILLAENDEQGQNAKAVEELVPRLLERGIKVGVARPPAGAKDFNDLVRLRDDKTRLHATAEAGRKIVLELIKNAARASRTKEEIAAGADAGPLPGLGDKDDGADAHTLAMEPGGLYRGKMFVCQPFEVVAQSRIVTDGRATDWGLRIRFKNPDGAVIEEPIAARDLYGEPMRLSAELASLGMNINNTTAAKSALATYLGSIKVKDRVLITTRTGWATVHGEPVFVLPSQTIGAGSERVVLAGDGRTVVYGQAGTLNEWKQHIGNPAGSHLLLQFGIAVSFAATLLQMSGGESGGFHLHEFSTKGKTTAQQVAASCWGSGALNGGFIRRWRATANSLEATFAAASDTCLILDEMSQAGYGEVSAIIYSVTGEVGKGRLRADATSRAAYSWRTLILSSGETSSRPTR
jgi:Domain of unknown function (DUF927)/Toprim domain